LEGYLQKLLVGHRKKIAKFLMRTFTCRSTFLYGNERVDGDTREVARQPMGSRKRVEGPGEVGHG
jgi:hypothetical protein